MIVIRNQALRQRKSTLWESEWSSCWRISSLMSWLERLDRKLEGTASDLVAVRKLLTYLPISSRRIMAYSYGELLTATKNMRLVKASLPKLLKLQFLIKDLIFSQEKMGPMLVWGLRVTATMNLRRIYWSSYEQYSSSCRKSYIKVLRRQFGLSLQVGVRLLASQLSTAFRDSRFSSLRPAFWSERVLKSRKWGTMGLMWDRWSKEARMRSQEDCPANLARKMSSKMAYSSRLLILASSLPTTASITGRQQFRKESMLIYSSWFLRSSSLLTSSQRKPSTLMISPRSEERSTNQKILRAQVLRKLGEACYRSTSSSIKSQFSLRFFQSYSSSEASQDWQSWHSILSESRMAVVFSLSILKEFTLSIKASRGFLIPSRESLLRYFFTWVSTSAALAVISRKALLKVVVLALRSMGRKRRRVQCSKMMERCRGTWLTITSSLVLWVDSLVSSETNLEAILLPIICDWLFYEPTISEILGMLTKCQAFSSVYSSRSVSMFTFSSTSQESSPSSFSSLAGSGFSTLGGYGVALTGSFLMRATNPSFISVLMKLTIFSLSSSPMASMVAQLSLSIFLMSSSLRMAWLFIKSTKPFFISYSSFAGTGTLSSVMTGWSLSMRSTTVGKPPSFPSFLRAAMRCLKSEGFLASYSMQLQ